MENLNDIKPEDVDEAFLNDLSLALGSQHALNTDYRDDVIDTMFKDQEVVKIRQRNDSDLRTRKEIIKIMKKFARQHEFFTTTLHLGVRLLDRHLNNYDISESDDNYQKFVGLVALILAAKSEDLDEKVPSIKDLQYSICLSSFISLHFCSDGQHSDEEIKASHREYLDLYCDVEFKIFQSSRFSTIRPTAASFIDAFDDMIVTEADLNDLGEIKERLAIRTLADLKFFSDRYLRSLLNTVLEVVLFQSFVPSKLAACVVAGTRKLIGIQTIWPSNLSEGFRCTYPQIEHLVNALIKRKVDSDDQDEDYEIKVDNNAKKTHNSRLTDSGCFSNTADQSAEEPMETN